MEESQAAMPGIRESFGLVQGILLRLEVVVLLSALILAALVLYGSAHRRSSDKVLRGAMWMAYSLSYVVVSYAVGIIQDGPFRAEAFALWAAALLLIQASAYAAPVHSRRDVDQRKRLLLQHVLQTGLVLWLILNATGRNASYRAAIWAFWALNVLKTAAKIVEMIKVSRPDTSVKVVAEYMDVEEALASDQRPDPVTMQGYKYIFHGEDTMVPVSHGGGGLARQDTLAQNAGRSVVTIDQVYKWIDRQPYSEVEKDRARDFCLAFALFKLLKRRFYGYVPAEAGSQKARDLVLTGLIHEDATGPDAAFRVVEAELAFLYDFLYTRTIVLVGAKTYICIAVAVAGITMWTAFFGALGPGYHRLLIGVRNLDRSVTVLIVVITAGLEVFQAVAGFSSNWRYIKTLYRCVRDDRPWSRRWRGHHLWWNESITPPETKYWEDKVGEYVLLERFHHHPWNLLSWLTLYLVEPRRQGQKRGRRKPLPPEVKRAVLLSLKRCRCQPTNGIAALRSHGLQTRLSWACKFPKITDQILVWHVVTTRCDWASDRPGRSDTLATVGGEHRLIATKLSNYCAYLVAFVPEMLPDPSYNAEQIFDTAVQQARDHLGDCRTERSILARLEEMEANELAHPEGMESCGVHERASRTTVIERAALLGGQLRAAVRTDARRWQVLAEFWTELVLFLAPSDNVDIHAEMLGAGGEFMTQLWALLAHAGVLDRPAGHVSATMG
ncbi:uncharacterized protein LOC133884147 [Phragmites australis]|uniref:uncharacterized protein LOC133884147 n=1 Tax=Phragmites australis TaxID=29695 RepID=UPI002D773B9A|nr:uncharacterized protein LOC133884147 [Phragmites australis]